MSRHARATVSWPCNCRMSGCSVSTMLASVASSASTVSATFDARGPWPAGRVARASQSDMPRRRRKEHEPDHVGAGLQRRVERLARGQAANLDEQGHGSLRQPKRRVDRADGAGLQRRALLVSPAQAPVSRRCAGAGRRWIASRPQRWSADRPAAVRAAALGLVRRAARASGAGGTRSPSRRRTPMIATAMMTTNSGRVTATVWIGGIERIERHRHQMAVRDREDDEEQANGDRTRP